MKYSQAFTILIVLSFLVSCSQVPSPLKTQLNSANRFTEDLRPVIMDSKLDFEILSSTSSSKKQKNKSNITKQEFIDLENMLLNSNYPTIAKEFLTTSYLKELKQKHNLSSKEVSTLMKSVFKKYLDPAVLFDYDYNEELNDTRMWTLRKVQKELGYSAAFLKFLQPESLILSKQVNKLREESQLQQFKTETANRIAVNSTNEIFQSLEEVAAQNANDIIAFKFQKDPSRFRSQLKSISKLGFKEKNAKILQTAAALVKDFENVPAHTQSSLTGMIAEKLTTLVENKVKSQAEQALEEIFRTKVDIQKFNEAKESYIKLTETFGEYAKTQAKKLSEIKKEIEQYAKENLRDQFGTPELNGRLQITMDKVGEVANGAKSLIEIGERIGVPPKIIAKAKSAVVTIEKGLAVGLAFVSPTPMTVMAAVSALTPGMGGQQQDASAERHQEVMARLDTIVALQQKTLSELADIKEGIKEVLHEVRQNRVLIYKLSAQVAESSQQIKDKLNVLSFHISSIEKMVKDESRKDFNYCLDLISHRNLNLLQEEHTPLETKIYVGRCLDSIYKIKYENDDGSMTPFFMVRNNKSEILLRMVKVLEQKKSKFMTDLGLTPFHNYADHFDAQKSFTLNEMSKPIIDWTIEQSTENGLIQPEYLSAFAKNISKGFSSLRLFEAFTKTKSATEILRTTIANPNDENLKKRLMSLAKFMSSAVLQQTIISGMLLNLEHKELQELNFPLLPSDPRPCKENQGAKYGSKCFNDNTVRACMDLKNLDEVFCPLAQSEIARKNLLNFHLLKDLNARYGNPRHLEAITWKPDLASKLEMMKYLFPPFWDFKIETEKITANVAGFRVPIEFPNDELPNIQYERGMQLLIAAREDLNSLLVDLHLNSSTNEKIRRSLVSEILLKTL